MLLVLPVVLLGLTACSPRDFPDALDVDGLPGALVVRVDGVGGVLTADGRTWRGVTQEEKSALQSELKPPSPQSSACVPDDPEHCYRAMPGRLGVEESTDGGRTWRTAWAISPGRQRFLSRAYPDDRATRTSPPAVETKAIGVLPTAAGHVVVAASGRDGALVRHEDGRWERVTFAHDPERPPPLTEPGRRIGPELLLAALAAGLSLLFGGAGARRRNVHAGAWLAVATLGFYASVAVVWLLVGLDPSTDVRLVAALLGHPVALWWTVAVSSQSVPAWRALLVVAVATLVATAAMVPMYRWSTGGIDGYETARTAFLWCVLAGIVATALAGALTAWSTRPKVP